MASALARPSAVVPGRNASLVLSPRGHLSIVQRDDEPPLGPDLALRLLDAFTRGAGHGLLQLGAREVGTLLPPTFSYWRAFAARFVTALCTLPEAEEPGPAGEQRRQAEERGPRVAPPADADLEALADAAPPMEGAEYLTAAVLGHLWEKLDTALGRELAEAKTSLQDFLKHANPAWNLVGRVHFHLAENRKDEEAPFAFMATYSTRLSAAAKAQHLPLGQALREYAGASDKERLLSLLLPVQRAAERCDWLATMVDAGEIFHPLRWTPAEAYRFLRDVPLLESAGVVVRMPASWLANRPARPQVTAKVGEKAPAGLGQDALLDFKLELTLGGETLNEREIAELLAQSEGLAFLRGRWVEVDRERLGRMLARFQEVERKAEGHGLGFGEAMRLLSGAAAVDEGDTARWSQVVAGPWLAEVLQGLRTPQGMARIDPGAALAGTLRPYQEVGLRWLYLLSNLGLGACLADDMGLGKTIQVLALLLVLKKQRRSESQSRNQSQALGPSLLVAPASLLSNWAAEAARFAPSLRVCVAHPSAGGNTGGNTGGDLDALEPGAFDLVVTSYGQLLRLPVLAKTRWNLVILDEAQAIKNPDAKQTRAAKHLKARARFALTGTPIENRLGDLWSLFDFLNPGLLGSARDFGSLIKRLAERPDNPYGPLRELVRPYILRRLKTDKSVIADLPDKTEVKAYCQLSRKQAALYQQAVADLAEQVRGIAGGLDGMRRRGVVLAFLMRFKQVCNHPSQWLGDGAWTEEDSGKWARLRDIAEVVAARQEKMLVFTQFREVTLPLAAFLGSIFGRPGIILDGSTPVKKRQELVRQFQEDEAVPFFVLSLKAGGSGLNLTAASHVVHFDRWWNPAVENQATDRAFRIGQAKNVMVHKFLCRGTLEEKIDELIEAKRQLSQELLEGGADLLLTEMKDEDLLALVALDINAALKES